MAVVTIDGPAGAGKSTVARLLAERLGFIHLDTGAIYRALALHAQAIGLNDDQEDELAKIPENWSLTFDSGRVILNQQNVSESIRIPMIGELASNIAKHPKVRTALLDFQRDFALTQDVVVEGRDTGTVVFPKAEVKFFLTASVETRAGRRYEELLEKGQSASLEQIKKEVTQRDHQDSTRAVAPLKPAADATTIDTSNLDIDAVVDLLATQVRAKLSLR